MTDDFDPFADERSDGDDGLVTVDLEFATLRDFREKMAPYLGDRGFFARTEAPLPRSTPVHFRFVLPEGFALAEGTATVAWTIEPESNPDLIPGMALRFVDVGRQSRAVIRELVDFHIATGGDPFDLGPAASEPGEIPTDSLDAGAPGTDRELEFPPPSTSPEVASAAGPAARDDVLPDWLAETVDAGRFDFGEAAAPGRTEPEPPPPAAEDGAAASDDLAVEMIFDDSRTDSARGSGPGGSVRDAMRLQRSGERPPRDLRLGLMVAAALAVVAVAILVWSVWLRPRQPEAARVAESVEREPAPGVEMVTEQEEPQPAEAPAKVFVTEETPPDGMPTATTARPIPELAAPSTDLERTADRIVDVVASSRADLTTVVIRGNGRIEKGAVRIARLDDPARIWVRIRNIETFYRPNEILVESPQVLQVRVGHHPEETPASLYVVLDLADEAVVVRSSEVADDSVRLSVGRP